MGPLSNIKVLEFSGIGPGPYCGMLLADMGADVIRVGRKGTEGLENKYDIHNRSKRSITAALKNEDTVNEIQKLIDKDEVVIEELLEFMVLKRLLLLLLTLRRFIVGLIP